MREGDAVVVIDCLEAAGIEAWVDGGWGIDALLGRETRAHSDLDLVVRREEVDTARAALAPWSFIHVTDEQPGLPARLVVRDGCGRQVDFHPIVIDANGDGWQNLGDGRFGPYPRRGLRGEGRIGDRPVKCLTPGLQRAHHRGYGVPEQERRDLELLAERFGLQ